MTNFQKKCYRYDLLSDIESLLDKRKEYINSDIESTKESLEENEAQKKYYIEEIHSYEARIEVIEELKKDLYKL